MRLAAAPITAFKSRTVLSVLVLIANTQLAFSQGNCVINGGINNGIQIQNCPVIEMAPTPSFHIVKENPIKPFDKNKGTFIREAVIQIDAPYVPNNMTILATGPTVSDIIVRNDLAMFGGKSTDPSIHAYGVYEPSGQYTVAIITTDETTSPSLQIQFNVPNINWGGGRPPLPIKPQ